MSRSSAAVHRTKQLSRLRKLPGPWTTTWSKQHLSAVHPVTCWLLWVRSLFDRLSISDFPVLASGLCGSGLRSKVDQFVLSRHLSTRKISSKSVHTFLSNLANRETDKKVVISKWVCVEATHTSTYTEQFQNNWALSWVHLSTEDINTWKIYAGVKNHVRRLKWLQQLNTLRAKGEFTWALSLAVAWLGTTKMKLFSAVV